MTQEELSEALDGLMAYDEGATDSGIHDENLRARVKAFLESLDYEESLLMLSRHIREYYLTDEAIDAGYGIEAVAQFIRWLEKRMEFDL